MPAIKAKSGRVRREQVLAMRKGTRKLLHGPWFAPKLVPTEMQKPKPTVSGQKQLGRLQISRANRGVQLFNAEIIRVGHVPRQKRKQRQKIPTVQIPVSTTTFNDWYQGRRSREKQGYLRGKEAAAAARKKRASTRLDRQAHANFPFNIGINSILEVGKDARGQPTHIVITKRSAHVPEAPDYWDLPAGLIRAGQKPMDVINGRTAAEIGVDKSKIKLIGKGLKPARREQWFTLHRMDKATNYNAFVVQRANISAEEAERKIRANIDAARAKKDPWAATDFVLVPRNPEAIREFIRTHDKTWLPEALRLYAMELRKNKK